MNSKILSISVAAYNVEQYLRKTLDSLLLDDAHMEKLEVIVVNDGSKDSTQMIAEEYAGKYPDTVRVIAKENGGYGSTINASLAEAQGKYFKLLDGDDWFDTEALAGLIDFLEETTADLVVSPYYAVTSKQDEVEHHPEIPNTVSNIADVAIEKSNFQMHGIVVRTEALRALGQPIAKHCFYTDLEYLFYCLAASDTVVRYDRSVYCYRLGLNGQSVSKEGIQKHYKDHLVVTERICSYYEQHNPTFSGGKKELIDHTVTYSIYGAFNFCMVLPDSGKHKKELKAFDERLKEQYPQAYQRGFNSKIVRMVRRFSFRCYWAFCAYMKMKFGRW